MTIKEIEEQTGMTRTNIRFYETEGLIHPQRRDNGYRDYSQADVETLMKVKLLRSMDVTLDQVKAAASGQRQLTEILKALEREIEHRQHHQSRTQLALKQITTDGCTFQNLEPGKYLYILESSKPVEDAPPRLNLPWRRYWARCFDFSIYNVLMNFLLSDFQHRVIYIPILTLLTMLIVEPMLLSFFGTTLGKLIFGIRVTDREGGRLNYNTAIERTWTLMWEGEALRIPLICQYFQYKSLDLTAQEVPLSWEYESDLTFKDDHKWRYILFTLAVLFRDAFVLCTTKILGG